MKTTRKRYGADFKTRITLEAIRGDLALAELRCIHAKSHFLLSPTSFAIEAAGYRRPARWTEAVTLPLDERWSRPRWHVQHFVETEAAAEPIAS